MKSNSRTILLTGGTSWYLWNFRRNVMTALADAGWDVVAVAPEDEHSQRLNSLPGVSWVDWPVDLDGSRPDREFASLVRLAAIIRRMRPGFVVNHGIKANIYGGIACRFLSIPYANNITGLGMMLARSGPGPWLLAKLYAFSCAGARTLFVQNEDDLAFLQRSGLSTNVPWVRTIGSGVDLDRFAFAGMPPSSPRTFLFVGRFQFDKGIVDFVEAARALHSEHPEARFVAIGSRRHANRQAIPDDMLQGWSDEGIVEFPGHQEDVRPWLTEAHVLVLPSHGGEGVPRVILEAAAVGRPVIASDVPGCRDAVIEGETGYLHQAQDAGALADAIRRLVELPDEQLAAMSRAARADAEARFSDAHIIDSTLELVRRLKD